MLQIELDIELELPFDWLVVVRRYDCFETDSVSKLQYFPNFWCWCMLYFSVGSILRRNGKYSQCLAKCSGSINSLFYCWPSSDCKILCSNQSAITKVVVNTFTTFCLSYWYLVLCSLRLREVDVIQTFYHHFSVEITWQVSSINISHSF